MSQGDSNTSGTFSEEEKQAMRNRAKELKMEEKMMKNRDLGEKAIQDEIDKMKPNDQELAKKIHEIVSRVAPELMPKTWYGMPAYANNDGKAVCFFQAASKFDARYATFGFNDVAKLDDGNMWSTGFGLTKISDKEEAEIERLVKKAIG